jgi:hypothetical protein
MDLAPKMTRLPRFPYPRSQTPQNAGEHGERGEHVRHVRQAPLNRTRGTNERLSYKTFASFAFVQGHTALHGFLGLSSDVLSDEFVDVMLGKVVEALKPTPWDQLEEATLNAALANVASAHCRSELEAFIAVRSSLPVLRGLLSASKPEVHDGGLRQHLRPLRQQADQASTADPRDQGIGSGST